MNKYVVYTSIFDNYDFLKEPFCENKYIDFFCITDKIQAKSKKWQFITVNNIWDSTTLANRYYKIIGFKDLFHSYYKSIYIDGSVWIKGNMIELFENHNEPFLFIKHLQRECIFDEYSQCITEKRGNEEILNQQISFYTQLNMPHKYGLSDNAAIMRTHTDYCYNIMQQWWDEFQKYPSRDQISLPYILWNNNIKYPYLKETLDSNSFFEKGPHKKEYVRKIWTKVRIALFGTFLYPIISKIDVYQRKIRSIK